MDEKPGRFIQSITKIIKESRVSNRYILTILHIIQLLKDFFFLRNKISSPLLQKTAEQQKVLSASAAASEFCEWIQVGIDVYIPHRKYQVKPH